MAGVSTKDIKLRIRSLENTRQITRAMEMVASSKLRKAQNRVLNSRPYFEVLYEAICKMAVDGRNLRSRYANTSTSKRVCCIVIAGDRGLAGGYNQNVLRLAMETMEGKDAVFFPIGKKAVDFFRARDCSMITDAFSDAAVISISKCFTIAHQICQDYLNGDFDELYVVYTNYISMLEQTPGVLPILPLRALPRKGESHEQLSHPTLYEPSGEAVFDSIVPEYVGGVIYGALCESLASELSARRMAMDAATKNAEEMIEKLGLQYNRARQSAITQEITEIIAGSNA